MRLATAVFALTAVVTGQEPPRDRGFGRVLDQDGKPWTDAEVHLLHRPHSAITDPAFGDEIVRTSDAKGQFKADLLVGAAYAAWAIGPIDEDGTYRVTRLQRDAVARSPILLQERERQFTRRLRPVLHDSWTGHEHLRWRASIEGSGMLGLGRWLEPDANGALTMPRWPDDVVMLQAWTTDWLAYRVGFPLTASMARRFGVEFRSGQAKPTKDNVHQQMAAIHEFVVPPRRVRDLALRDAQSTEPIADAEVRLDNMPFDLTAHRSNDRGIVHAVFAHAEEMPREVPFKWTILPPENAEFSLDPSSYRDGDPPVLLRDLPAGRTVHGRLLWRPGEPAAGLPIMLEASVDSGAGGSWFGIDPRVFRSAKDGTIDIRGRCDRFPFRLTAGLSATMRARLARTDPAWPIAPLAVLHWGSSKMPANFGTLDLSMLRTLDVQVAQPDGTPPGSTRVLLTMVGIGTSAPHDPVTVYTDHRGRIRTLVPSTEDVLVHAVTAQGAAWQRLAADATTVDLTIDPRHVVRFRIVDGRGLPRAHAHVHLVAPDSYREQDQEVRRTMHDMCMVHAFARKSTTVDDNGYGTIIAPMLGVRLDLSIDTADIKQRVTIPWMGPTDEPLHLVIEK